MPDTADWKSLVDQTISRHDPEFSTIPRASRRRAVVRWTSALVALVLAVSLVFALRPTHRPSFRDQVSAFVDLVYRD